MLFFLWPHCCHIDLLLLSFGSRQCYKDNALLFQHILLRNANLSSSPLNDFVNAAAIEARLRPTCHTILPKNTELLPLTMAKSTTQTLQTLNANCIVVNNANKATDITARRLSQTFHQLVTNAVEDYVTFYEGLLKPTSDQGIAAIKEYIDKVRILLIIDKTI